MGELKGTAIHVAKLLLLWEKGQTEQKETSLSQTKPLIRVPSSSIRSLSPFLHFLNGMQPFTIPCLLPSSHLFLHFSNIRMPVRTHKPHNLTARKPEENTATRPVWTGLFNLLALSFLKNRRKKNDLRKTKRFWLMENTRAAAAFNYFWIQTLKRINGPSFHADFFESAGLQKQIPAYLKSFWVLFIFLEVGPT